MEKTSIFRWGESRSYKVSADIAGAVMTELSNTIGLTAQNLVNVSRPEDAPLHGCFEWDDSKAAESYREYQARKIIASIEIVSSDAVGGGMVEIEPVLPTRAFHALRTNDSEGYESIGQIMSDEEKMERLLELAKKDAQIFKLKYGHLQKLAKIMSAIDEAFGEGV